MSLVSPDVSVNAPKRTDLSRRISFNRESSAASSGLVIGNLQFNSNPLADAWAVIFSMIRGIIQAFVKFHRHNVRALAILLLIAATLSLQAASLSTDHSTDHLTHCCAFCHFAHLALANPARAL